jgi:hypothetical protein
LQDLSQSLFVFFGGKLYCAELWSSLHLIHVFAGYAADDGGWEINAKSRLLGGCVQLLAGYNCDHSTSGCAASCYGGRCTTLWSTSATKPTPQGMVHYYAHRLFGMAGQQLRSSSFCVFVAYILVQLSSWKSTSFKDPASHENELKLLLLLLLNLMLLKSYILYMSVMA